MTKIDPTNSIHDGLYQWLEPPFHSPTVNTVGEWNVNITRTKGSIFVCVQIQTVFTDTIHRERIWGDCQRSRIRYPLSLPCPPYPLYPLYLSRSIFFLFRASMDCDEFIYIYMNLMCCADKNCSWGGKVIFALMYCVRVFIVFCTTWKWVKPSVKGSNFSTSFIIFILFC